nr:restriction endonuclease subunit S [Enterobacter asburiae]
MRVGYVTEKGIITSAYLNLACLKHIEPRYAYFLLHSYDLTKVFYGMGGGLRQSMKFEDLKRLPIIFPPYSEQLSIVQFLDAETAKIDKLICKQSQLIELLKEKRQSVISKVATIRGDEKALKLSYCVDLLPGYAFPSSGYHFEKASNIRLLRGVNVGVDSIRWEDVVYWNVSDKIDLSAFELRERDIVIGMDRPWIAAGARVAEINKEDLPCLLLQRVARVRVNNGYYQPFIKMCLSSFEFKAFIESDLTGVSVPHLSPEQIKSFQIRNINMEQQKRETDKAVYLCNKLTEIENKAYEVIKYLTERRSALISAAVTGKIDVRKWLPDAKDVA